MDPTHPGDFTVSCCKKDSPSPAGCARGPCHLPRLPTVLVPLVASACASVYKCSASETVHQIPELSLAPIPWQGQPRPSAKSQSVVGFTGSPEPLNHSRTTLLVEKKAPLGLVRKHCHFLTLLIGFVTFPDHRSLGKRTWPMQTQASRIPCHCAPSAHGPLF